MSLSAVQQFAGHYLNLGFGVVPLRPRTKKAYLDSWPKTVFKLADFRPSDNIGLRSLHGLVVLDDDFETSSLGCDNVFLPSTGAIWGRPHKPRSKRLYYCPELTDTITFTDVDATHLYQLRVGQQDMAPPSIHPDTGERLKWHGLLLPPQEISREMLVGRARYRWTVGLMAKYWPTRGRHDLRLAYARVLLDTLGIHSDDATRILEWACRLGGSDAKGIQDAARAIDSTRERLAAGQPAFGIPKLADLLPQTGRQIVRLLRRAYGKTDAVEEAIEELNEHNAVVSVSNKVVVMETWPDGGIKTLWPFEEFKRKHIKKFVAIGDAYKPLADVWLKDSRGRQYDRLVYAMPGSAERCEPGDYNGWLGFTVTPQPGDWTKNRRHLQWIICGGKANRYEWVFNWCAALVQWPGRHAMSSLVLRGGQGVGKGHFAHLMLGALFHKQQYLHIIGEGMLTGRFNEHLSGKVLVFADESTWGGDPAAADKLKGMVTESTVPIERKFLPLVEEPSALHIVIASNNEWPIAIPMDDRRFMVLDVVETKRQDDEYFAPLREELKNGGLAAMLHDLLAHKVDEYALRHPLSTEAKREVMTQSLTAIQRWWYEKLLNGSLEVTVTTSTDEGKQTTVTIDGWHGSVPKSALHANYLAFLDQHRDTRTRRSTETELGMFLKKYTPMRRQHRLPGTDESTKARYVWDMPSLAECRAFWAKACGWPKDFEWDE
jgi:hypothetical protein